ncbi:hypothetical protein RI129_009439 [Pyrocoelia pectoralis]|uniref:Major facilitator superfamily (MFS) profile domain-containing protein n=1 Tax=Pyrocoelia pectoralis TaxID=417401 RepID=A0AAN7ZEW0_9COLE
MLPCTDLCGTSAMGRLKQLFATLCLGPITLGVSVSWTSPVLPQLESNKTVYHISSEDASWIGSVLGLGVLAAALPVGVLVDRFGPKICVIALVVPHLIFTVVAVISKNVFVLCIARFFSGMATGGTCVVSPIYMSEISDVRFRGTLGSFFECLIYVGVSIVAVIGAYVEYKSFTIVLGVAGLTMALLFFFLPDSPTYLVKVNEKEAAKRALLFYRSKNFDVSTEISQIENSLERKTKKLTLREALKSRRVVRGLIAAVGLTMFQRLCANDCVLFYAVNIFEAAQTGMNAYTSTIILALAQVIAAVINVFVVQMANRRTFLFISTLGMSLALALLGVFFQLKNLGVDFSGIGLIPLGCLIVHAFAFSTGMGPILWMINGELFAPDVKGLANGATMTTNWLLLSVVTKSFPIMMDKLGPNYTFYFFALCMLVCATFVKFCVPETRGKTLEQIQQELQS